MAQRMLIQDGSGAKFIWSEALAKRKDMRPYDPDKQGELDAPAKKLMSIDIQGKTFNVDPELHDLLVEMGSVMAGLQDQVATLTAEKQDFEAAKERLTTDILDLQEQLAAANGTIADLTGKLAATTEGKDEVLQESADKGNRSKKKAEG